MTPVIVYPGEAGWAGEEGPTTSSSHTDKTGLDRKSIHKKHMQANTRNYGGPWPVHIMGLKEIKSGFSHKYKMVGRGSAKWKIQSLWRNSRYSVITDTSFCPTQGPQGKQGLPGLPGIDGPPVSTHTHINLLSSTNTHKHVQIHAYPCTSSISVHIYRVHKCRNLHLI